MHDTARCLGYPSDSTRAARERSLPRAARERETTSGSQKDRAGQARMGRTPPSQSSASTRPGGSPLAPVAQLRLSSPRWLNSPLLWLNSRTPGRRRRTSHWPWAYSPGVLAGVSDQTRPQRHCRRDRRAVGGRPELARTAGGTPDAS